MAPELHPKDPDTAAPPPDVHRETISLRASPIPTASVSAAPNRPLALDRLLILLVLILAFLSGSFLARNSDLWFHLATGRLVANGEFVFGADPFSYATQRVYWACHSWLFDVGLYTLRGLIGDAALVVLKALLVAALAALLLSVRRPAAAPWIPVVCTTLAILAMSPRLLLQPACASYFLLGLTFWLLWRPHARYGGRGGPTAEPGRFTLASIVGLLFVFALWANVDEWFFLGPLLVALFWLGERLSGERVTPAWLVAAGVAACLLNPYTFHVFTPPTELSSVSWTSGLRDDPRFHNLFASPWGTESLLTASRLNAAVLAYFALVLLGLVSFMLNPSALRGWRLLVWLPFAALAAWQARTIPFFAVVAAPITALNAQDFLASRRTDPRKGMLPFLGKMTLALGLLALMLLAWMGWLAGYDREERHVAWGIVADPSLQQATETLDFWRRQGLLSEGEHVFALAPEVAQYGAFFCPAEKQFFDHRYPLYPEAARDFETACHALLFQPDAAGPGDARSSSIHRRGPRENAPDWREVFRANGVGIVVYYDRDPERLFAVLQRLAGDTEHWTLLHIAGQALIAGWNDARPNGGFDRLRFDPEQLVFGPQNDRAQREAPSASEQGPVMLPQRRDFWARLSRPPAIPSWGSPAATMYLHYFGDIEMLQGQRERDAAMSRCAASLAGLPAQPAALPQVLFQLISSQEVIGQDEAAPRFLVREQLGPFFEHLVERPPALPLLAVRAARRAVVADPEDANAWFRLGQAYLLLRDRTVERSGEGRLPPLSQLRQIQIVTALEQALRLDPNLEAAHHELAFVYGASNCLDRALDHRREELRISRRLGPRRGETAEQFSYRLELMEKDTAKLVILVEDGRKAYANAPRSPQGDRVAQAKFALKQGLAETALEDVLMRSPADLLGAPGIQLELELLLSLGQAEKVRTILNEDRLRANKHGLGIYLALPNRWPAYEWLHVLEAAAVGDYAQGREDLRAIRAMKHSEYDQLGQQTRDYERRVLVVLPGLLSGPPRFLPAFTAQLLGHALEEKAVLEAQERILRAQQADLCVLEGLLALEQGDTVAARSAFAEAREWCAAIPSPSRPIAASYLGSLSAKQSAAPARE
jgi:hypothetical protein